MKNLVLIGIFILGLFASCSKESTSPIEYDINGVWTGNGDFTVVYHTVVPRFVPGEMDIEFIFSNGKFIKLSYNLLLEGNYYEDTRNDGVLTRTGNEIYIEIFNTSKDGTRAKRWTFTGTILNENTIVGSLTTVREDVEDFIADNGDFILKKL